MIFVGMLFAEAVLANAQRTYNGADHHITPHQTREAYSQPFAGLDEEERAHVHWEYHAVVLADGTSIRLRKPRFSFSGLGYGPLDTQQEPLLMSARVGPVVFGLGLLDAVTEQTLVALAQQQKPDGISGKVNPVWDIASQRTRIGRFGAKANTASLRGQIVEAMLSDLGITSSLLAKENCLPGQAACLRALSGGTPELNDGQLADLEFYFRHLAVPARRNLDAPEVRAGEKIFTDLGCALCHLPALITDKHSPYRHLAGLTIQPYTDFLLHDMGAGLGDNRPDYQASGREWRTPPLWGIGLTELVSEYQSYLHDGRAQTFAEAILWHGGEAETARDRYSKSSRTERRALDQFLLSL